MTTGKLIVFEGSDGSGKSTQSKILSDRLHADKLPVLWTNEPSTGPIGRLIRGMLQGDTNIARNAMGPLFAADRVDHAERGIQPALERGEIVVCDRYTLSNTTYRAAETEGPLFECRQCGWTGDICGIKVFDNEPPRLPSGWQCNQCSAGEAADVLPTVDLSRAVRKRLLWAHSLDGGLAPKADLTIVLDVTEEVATSRRKKRGMAEAYDGDKMQARVRSLYKCVGAIVSGENIVTLDSSGTKAETAEVVWNAVQKVLKS